MKKTAIKKNTKKPQQVEASRVARLLAVSLGVILVTGLIGLQINHWFEDPANLPIRIVRIDGQLEYLKKTDLQETVAPVVTGGYFNIDLHAISHKARQLAWVDAVSVKRIWPDTVVMNITERQAIARWGEKQLVTARGEVFLPPGQMPEGLPLIDGPKAMAAQMVKMFDKEKQRFSVLKLTLKELHLNKRGAWSMQFSQGMKVALGRTGLEERIQRLADNYSAIEARGKPLSVDMRYRHGIAVMYEERGTTDDA